MKNQEPDYNNMSTHEVLRLAGYDSRKVACPMALAGTHRQIFRISTGEIIDFMDAFQARDFAMAEIKKSKQEAA